MTHLDDYLDISGQMTDLTADLDSLAADLGGDELLEAALGKLDEAADLIDKARADFTRKVTR